MKVVKSYWGNHVHVISAINDSTTVEGEVCSIYGSFLVATCQKGRQGRQGYAQGCTNFMYMHVLVSCICHG